MKEELEQLMLLYFDLGPRGWSMRLPSGTITLWKDKYYTGTISVFVSQLYKLDFYPPHQITIEHIFKTTVGCSLGEVNWREQKSEWDDNYWYHITELDRRVRLLDNYEKLILELQTVIIGGV